MARPPADEKRGSRRRPAPAFWSNDTATCVEFKQENPKKRGSASAIRYDQYKRARTVQEALDLGAHQGDLMHDHERGFVKVVGAASARAPASLLAGVPWTALDAGGSSASGRVGKGGAIPEAQPRQAGLRVASPQTWATGLVTGDGRSHPSGDGRPAQPEASASSLWPRLRTAAQPWHCEVVAGVDLDEDSPRRAEAWLPSAASSSQAVPRRETSAAVVGTWPPAVAAPIAGEGRREAANHTAEAGATLQRELLPASTCTNPAPLVAARVTESPAAGAASSASERSCFEERLLPPLLGGGTPARPAAVVATAAAGSPQHKEPPARLEPSPVLQSPSCEGEPRDAQAPGVQGAAEELILWDFEDGGPALECTLQPSCLLTQVDPDIVDGAAAPYDEMGAQEVSVSGTAGEVQAASAAAQEMPTQEDSQSQEAGDGLGTDTIRLRFRLGLLRVKEELPDAPGLAAPAPAEAAAQAAAPAAAAAAPAPTSGADVLRQLLQRGAGEQQASPEQPPPQHQEQQPQQEATESQQAEEQFEAAQLASYEANASERRAREAQMRESVRQGDVEPLYSLDRDFMEAALAIDGMFDWLESPEHRVHLLDFVELSARACKWYGEPAEHYFEQQKRQLEDVLAHQGSGESQEFTRQLCKVIAEVRGAMYSMPEVGRPVPRLFAPDDHDSNCVELE